MSRGTEEILLVILLSAEIHPVEASLDQCITMK